MVSGYINMKYVLCQTAAEAPPTTAVGYSGEIRRRTPSVRSTINEHDLQRDP